MSKELKIMKDTKYRLKELGYDENVLAECDLVIKALERLESVDNANPSEALECLENLWANLTPNTYCEKYADKDVAIIKQALLKAQKPKQYLKWEDLKTDNENVRVDLKVSLNGTKYRLSYFTNVTLKLLTNDEDFYLEIENKQFFNDLHLERVE